jgi:hypothetical protein
MLDKEEVLVGMKGDHELVQEPLRPEDPLKGHLKGPVGDEGDPCFPRVSRVGRQAQFDVLELDSPCLAQQRY